MVEFHKSFGVSLKGADQSVSSGPVNIPRICKPLLARRWWDAELARERRECSRVCQYFPMRYSLKEISEFAALYLEMLKHKGKMQKSYDQEFARKFIYPMIALRRSLYA